MEKNTKENIRVLLIRPQPPNKLSFIKILDSEPLELEYLHTVLQKEDIEDIIYDGIVEKSSPIDFIKTYQPDVIGITGYITQEKQMIRICQESKEILPKVLTILGGVHAQLNHERLQKDPVDYILRSESVEAFMEIIRYIQSCRDERGKNKKEEELQNINGLSWKKEGTWQNNPLFPIDINTLPIPERSFFYKHQEKYRYLALTKIATIKTSFSCPYSCNFCYCTHLAGGQYRVRDLELVIEEIQGIHAQNIQIADDDFLVNPVRIQAFIQKIKEKGIKKTFVCYARADFVSQHAELIKDLTQIGFRYFLVGLEAVNNNELDGYNKGTQMEHNASCVKVIHQSGASCIALMIAPIDATKESFENLFHWIQEQNLYYVTVSIFTPIPGTPLYEEYKDKITSTDMEEWDFLHLVLEPEKMSRKSYYAAYNKLFIKLYQRARQKGIYDFMDMKYYYNLLRDYLRRKIQEG